jgi:hypothetical protein
MIDVEAKGLPDLRRALRGFESQIPKAVSQSINFTAERVQVDLRDSMRLVFDSPKPATLNSAGKIAATSVRLFAQVALKDKAGAGSSAKSASEYLSPQIGGGPRSIKGLEKRLRAYGFIGGNDFMLPGKDAPRDKYGNITGGQIYKALLNVGAAATYSAGGTKRSEQAKPKYFWLGGKGIYYRQGKALREFMMRSRPPSYKPIFDFVGVATASTEKHLPEQIQRSIDRVLRNAGLK